MHTTLGIALHVAGARPAHCDVVHQADRRARASTMITLVGRRAETASQSGPPDDAKDWLDSIMAELDRLQSDSPH